MRQYDPNPGLSAFAVVIGAVLGLVAGILLGFSGLGVLAMVLAGVLLTGFAASATGIVGERRRPEREEDDLPAHYHDY